MSKEDEDHQIWLIACARGIDVGQARQIWEMEQLNRKQALETQKRVLAAQKQQEEDELGTVEAEEEESEESVPSRREIIAEVEEETIRKRKLRILDEIEEQLEKDKQNDLKEEKERQNIQETQKSILEKQRQLSEFWLEVTNNPSWENILKNFFRIVHGMTKGMCAKTVLTIEEKDGTIHFDYMFFDEKGQPVITEFNDRYGAES